MTLISMNAPSPKELSELIMIDEDFCSLSKTLDVYCPFEALGASRQEIRHSRFLADILSPNRPHGFGDRILKKFLESVLQTIGEDILALNIHLQDLTNAEIRREWKNIDLLIRIPDGDGGKDLILALEIKVESAESKGQLDKYTEIVKAEWPKSKKIFIFLTPPENEKPTHAEWNHIYFDSVIWAIEDYLLEEGGTATARAMLESYKDMIRRNYMSAPDMEKLAAKIWERHRLVLDFLIENQPFPIQPILDSLHSKDFLEAFNESLKEKGKGAISVERMDTGKRICTFRIVQWNKYNDIESISAQSPPLIKAEVQISEKKCAARLVLCPGDQDTRKKIYDVLVDYSVVSKQKKGEITAHWTRFSSKTIRDRRKMEEMIADFENEPDEKKISIIHKLNNDIITALTDSIIATDNALNEAAQKKLIE